MIVDIKDIRKKFGDESIFCLGERRVVSFPVISTGSIGLDRAMGIGGFPRGRISEIYGSESTGKSTLALRTIAEAQKAGDSSAAIIDMEHAIDPNWSETLGVDVNSLLISQPDSAEEALDIAQELIKSGVDILVVDSVAALIPKAERDGSVGDSFMGLHARMMSQTMRKITSIIHSNNTCMIFINQTRALMGQTGYGPKETTTGGKALKFYASIRVEVRKAESIKNGEEVIGNRTVFKIVKNKLAAPFKEASIDMIYGEGPSRELEAIDLGMDLGIIAKSGAWLAYKEEKLGNGREKSRIALKENPKMLEKIEAEVLRVL